MKKLISFVRDNRYSIVLLVLYTICAFVAFHYLYRFALHPKDCRSYINDAHHLLSHRFFSQDGRNPDYYRTPGYPLFLAAVFGLGGHIFSVAMVQTVLSSVAVVLIYAAVARYFEKPFAAIIAASLYIVNLPHYFYINPIISDGLFAFLIVLSAFFFMRWLTTDKRLSWFLLFAVSINYALLVRPILLYFNALLCLVFLVMAVKRTVKIHCFAVFTLLFVLTFSGWSYRNYLHSGVFVFSTVRNYNLFYFDGALLASKINHTSTKEARHYMEGLFAREYPDTRNLNPARLNALKGKFGQQFIRAHFKEYLLMNARGLFTTLFGPGASDLTLVFGHSKLQKAVSAVIICYLFVIYTVYLAGLIAHAKKLRLVDLFMLVLAVYLAVASASLGYSRFRTPIFPLIIMAMPLVWRFSCHHAIQTLFGNKNTKPAVLANN